MKRTPIALAVTLALLPGVSAAQQLEEVIVTAQKKEETLTSAPVAVTAISGQEIQDLSIFTADELNKLVTGMEVRYEGDSNVGVGLRGVGTFQQQSAPARVGVYLDDYYMASQASVALGSLYDMANVQILKGPQGTLYGQPSPTGAMILGSNDPNFDGINGYVQGSYQGDPEGYNVQGAVNIPLIDNQLAVRFAGVSDDRETGLENIVRGIDEERNRWGIRTKILWEPTDTFSAKLGYTYLKTEDSDTYRALETIDPALANFNIDASDNAAIADAPDEMKSKEDKFATLHLNWLIGDIEAKFFAGMLDSDIESVSDLDNTDFPGGTLNLGTQFGDGGDSYQTELRVSGTAFDIWDWTVGGYYSEAKSQTDVLTQVNRAADGGVFDIFLDIPIDSKTKAIFTHNTIQLTENMDLTVGVRYNEFDQTSSNTIDGNFLFGSSLLPGGEVTPPLAEFESVFPCFDGNPSPCAVGADLSKEEWTGTIKLSYFFSDELNVYGTIDRGYRPGAPNFDTTGVFQPTPESPGTDLNFYEGESVDSFEIGAKGDLFDGRARYTAAFFYSRYEDYQTPVNFVAWNGATGEPEVISNAPFVNVDEAVQQGIEADFRMLVTDAWMIYGGVTYTNVEFTDGVVPCTDPSQPPVSPSNRFNTCDADGEVASGMPEWTGVLQSEYTWSQLFLDSDAYINVLASYKGDTEAVGDTTGRLDGDDFVTVDLYTGLRNETWSAQLFVKNLFDDDGVLSKRPVGQAYNELTITPAQTIGVTATYNF